MTPELVEVVRRGAMLHDIVKLAIMDSSSASPSG